MLPKGFATLLVLIAASIVIFGCSFTFSLPSESTTAPPNEPTLTSSPVTETQLPPTSIQVTDMAASPTLTATLAPVTGATQPFVVTPGAASGPYAVILVPTGDVLNIRSGAGVGNPVVGSFASTFTNVMRTGPSAKVGDSSWVQVQNPGGGTGWVNASYLTEYVTSSTFCQSPQVTTLLNDLKSAVLTSNGKSLASLVSPTHGLDLRFWRYGTLVNYDREHAKFLFDSTFQVNWGPAPGSGEDTLGSFSSVVLPKLSEVFGANYELHCNDTLDLATFSLIPWPQEYGNTNFYAVHFPGTETYGGLDWRTWLAGVEFVDGKPYLISLIHFQWEP